LFSNAGDLKRASTLKIVGAEASGGVRKLFYAPKQFWATFWEIFGPFQNFYFSAKNFDLVPKKKIPAKKYFGDFFDYILMYVKTCF
jgi:hypothetical protein